ncbi:MAG: hypothetical protein JWQ54_4971 [Mucilaginibacter sp.]|jgi:hypothetical protein|nr:hypothetical protein [Mucilaginibacter sp.]
MLLQKKQVSALNQQRAQVLKTEGPLCEKDEQGESIERTKLLQKEALEKWERLKRTREQNMVSDES